MHVQEINLSCTPKFHMLHEHVPNMLLEMNGLFDMGEDTIERWHQIRMCHHARIRTLRSSQRKKNSQAKYEHVHNNTTMKKYH